MLITAEDAGRLYAMTKATINGLIKRKKLKPKAAQAKVLLHPNCPSSVGRYRVQKVNMYCAKELDAIVRATGREVLEYAQIKTSKQARLSAE